MEMKEGPRNHTYDLNLLSDSLSAWERSPGLRCVYADIYRGIRARCTDGGTLEIGSGIGVGKAFFENLVTSDVVKTSYVDRAISAYEIEPDAGGAWANIFAIDVLHHLTQPMRFFKSAAAALKPGGRIILTEPAATFGGRLFYSLFHHEPTCPHLIRAPYEFKSNTADGGYANMGMGVGLFRAHRPMLDEQLAMMGLRCVEVKFRDVFAYPLTGGYSKPQLLPTIALRALLKLEKYLPQFVYQWFGLRMMITLEKI
jgi:SAM-dependent methyltransferase